MKWHLSFPQRDQLNNHPCIGFTSIPVSAFPKLLHSPAEPKIKFPNKTLAPSPCLRLCFLMGIHRTRHLPMDGSATSLGPWMATWKAVTLGCYMREEQTAILFIQVMWGSYLFVADQPILDHTISSVTQSCLTLCDPMNCRTPGFPVHHQLPELVQILVLWVSDAIQPSLLSPSPPALNLSQDQGLFKWINSSHMVAKVFEFQL